ncbi:hypothetical protein [Butyricimonas faecihominis]|uniref:hypothetical protein n=1 Tax=Butyricimonas faecihominis TaxID=1472416 RepID=UPI0032C17907
MEKQFNQNLNNWLQEVANGCHQIATNSTYNMDMDFYVFQSSVSFQPELMIIGSNPGGEVSYRVMNQKWGRERRTANDLGISECNQFIVNDGWGSMRSLCELFSGPILRPVFEKAVITNIVYFNTGSCQGLRKRMNQGGREALQFCVRKNLELIRILCPQHIVLMGNPVRDNLMKYFDKPLQSLLTTPSGGLNLIQETTLNGIPTYCIHHPSLNYKFNTGENQRLKRATFETIFSDK